MPYEKKSTNPRSARNAANDATESQHDLKMINFKWILLYFRIMSNSVMSFAMLYGIAVLSLIKVFLSDFRMFFCFKAKVDIAVIPLRAGHGS